MNRYPTDEELNRFIEELEKEELYAPGYLKEEILLKAAKLNQEFPTGNKRAQPISFLTYSLKMAVGMAAAVFLVFAIPMSDGSNISNAGLIQREASIADRLAERRTDEIPAPRERIGDKLDEKTERIGKAVNSWFEKIGNKFNFDEIGGNDDEN